MGLICCSHPGFWSILSVVLLGLQRFVTSGVDHRSIRWGFGFVSPGPCCCHSLPIVSLVEVSCFCGWLFIGADWGLTTGSTAWWVSMHIFRSGVIAVVVCPCAINCGRWPRFRFPCKVSRWSLVCGVDLLSCCGSAVIPFCCDGVSPSFVVFLFTPLSE